MAHEFPRYLSNKDATNQQPSAFAPKDTSGEIIAAEAEASSQMLGAAQKALGQWGVRQKEIQQSNADVNQRMQTADLLARAEADPDYNALEKYYKENEDIRKSATEGMSPFAAQEVNAKHDLATKLANIQLNGIFKKKQIDKYQSDTLTLIDLETKNPRPESFQIIKNRLDQDVQRTFMNRVDATKLLQRSNDDLGSNRINQDLFRAQTPEQVDYIKQAITSGAYEQGGVTIDPEKKKVFLDIADRAENNLEKKLQAQAIEGQARNRMETVLGISSNDPKFQNLDLAAVSEYDPQLANVITKVKDFMVNYNPQIPTKDQPLKAAGIPPTTTQLRAFKDYSKSITDVFMQSDNKELGEFVLRELEKKGDGLTPSVKIAAFTNLAFLKAKVNNPQTPEDSKAASKFNAIKAGVKFLQTSNPYLAPEAIGDFIVKNFLQGGKTNEEIMGEARGVLTDKIIDRYKSVAKLPSVPNKIVDGEASVEDLQSGANELDGEEEYSGNYGSQDRSE
jgi:hypothetical protein